MSDADLTAKWMASKHEDAHLELNSSTIYGGILMCYANLNAIVNRDPNIYLAVLKSMVQKSQTAHEAFATWMSMLSFKGGNSEHEANAFYLFLHGEKCL